MDTQPPDNLDASLEAPQDPIEIKEENAITLAAALQIAQDASLSLGLSTLQRWAKIWREKGSKSPVKSILPITRSGKEYKIDRDDFTAWVLREKENARPSEVSQDPVRPRDVSRDPATPRETLRDPNEIARVKELENENLQLKSDLGVRKQLLERVKDEIDGLRSMTDNLLRENGALQYQIHQLPPPPPSQPHQTPEVAHVDNSTTPNEGVGV
jgi:hypothetical protein